MQHHDGRRRIGPRPDHAVFEPQRRKVEKAGVGERHAAPPLCGVGPIDRHNPQQLGKTLLHRGAGGVDLGLGAGIVGAARFEDRERSAIAARFCAIGRKSPCAMTRLM